MTLPRLLNRVRRVGVRLAAVCTLAASALPASAGVIAPILDGPFNALVFGNFRSSHADAQGTLVVGGTVELSSYGVNTMSGASLGLWSGAGGTLTDGRVYGNLTDNITLSNAGVTGGTAIGLGDGSRLASMQSYYTALSASYANDVGARNAYRTPWGGLVLEGSAAQTSHVFNVRAEDLVGTTWLDIRNIDPNEKLVLNIIGANASFSDIDLSSTLGRYNTLLNYVDASIVNFNATGAWADILAPYATITGSDGHLQGTVVAAGFNSNLELHLGKTDFWNVPSSPGASSSVPVPGTLLLAALGLVPLVWSRREQRAGRVVAAV